MVLTSIATSSSISATCDTTPEVGKYTCSIGSPGRYSTSLNSSVTGSSSDSSRSRSASGSAATSRFTLELTG